MLWLGTRGTIGIKGYGFRKSSGSLAILLAVLDRHPAQVFAVELDQVESELNSIRRCRLS
jgi:hypothetical protein